MQLFNRLGIYKLKNAKEMQTNATQCKQMRKRQPTRSRGSRDLYIPQDSVSVSWISEALVSQKTKRAF